MTLPLLPDEKGFWYPTWRAAWEELDPVTRTRIGKTVRGGSALSDPLEARFAVTVAYREQALWRWWPIFSLVLVGFSVVALVFLFTNPLADWSWSDWLMGGAAALVVLLYPPLAYRRYRRSVTAERLNREVVQHQAA